LVKFNQGNRFKNFRPRSLFTECQFCKDKTNPDYKDVENLKRFVKETGKITPRKVNGNCAKHQRKLTEVVKRARLLALLPFA